MAKNINLRELWAKEGKFYAGNSLFGVIKTSINHLKSRLVSYHNSIL